MKLKRMVTLLLAVCFTASMLVGFGGNQETTQQKSPEQGKSQEPDPDKKAILVVSFGTSYNETRKACIESVENKIAASFPDYEIRRAFTSEKIIKKLKERDNLVIDSPAQALQKLKEEGFSQVVVQSLHVIPGAEYDEVRAVVAEYANDFDKIMLGRPLLYSKGDEEKNIPDDYTAAVEAFKQQLPELTDDMAVVVMGHGSYHPANASYSCLQGVLLDMGQKVYVGTVKGYPTLDNVKKHLEANQIKKVTLMPYMLVAGDHAQNDLAGDEEDSWKSQLEKEGYTVDVYMHGLGENPAYQDIFVQNVKDAIAGGHK